METTAQPLTFKVQRNTFTVDKGDRFLDNGACIQFRPLDDSKRPSRRSGLMSWKPTVKPKDKDWKAMLASGRFERVEQSDKLGSVVYYIFKG